MQAQIEYYRKDGFTNAQINELNQNRKRNNDFDLNRINAVVRNCAQSIKLEIIPQILHKTHTFLFEIGKIK